jgi:Mg/Co/Ni transporter MgtE
LFDQRNFRASIPIVMRKIGTDPATASSIILTLITRCQYTGRFSRPRVLADLTMSI